MSGCESLLRREKTHYGDTRHSQSIIYSLNRHEKTNIHQLSQSGSQPPTKLFKFLHIPVIPVLCFLLSSFFPFDFRNLVSSNLFNRGDVYRRCHCKELDSCLCRFDISNSLRLVAMTCRFNVTMTTGSPVQALSFPTNRCGFILCSPDTPSKITGDVLIFKVEV